MFKYRIKKEGKTIKSLLIFLYEKLNLILLLPHPTAIGNCSEEIFEAIRIASLRQKKILLLLPIYLNTKFIPVKTLDPRLFAIESRYFIINPLSKGLVPLRIVIWCIFIPLIVVTFCLRLIGVSWIKGDFYPYYGTFILFNLSEKLQKKNFKVEDIKNEKRARSLNLNYDLRLSNYIKNKGNLFMNVIGKRNEEWFVCLHVRTSGFYKDEQASPYRNANIFNYFNLINSITEKGGWVFRLGDRSMPKLEKDLFIHPRNVIDLPYSKYNSAEINAWLIANCNSYIGMQSGPYDYAKLFLKPIILLNMYSPFFGIDNEKNIIGFYKKFINRNSDTETSFLDIVKDSKFVSEDFTPVGYDLMELNNLEILRYASDLIPVKNRNFEDLKNQDLNCVYDSLIIKTIERFQKSGQYSDTQICRWVFRSIHFEEI